ncbi:hypothetical protein C8J57DRAFT_1232839 [Mycena rebaudengoi]|nr:hypothetical protein C8J57DRAFT_1232839 [Mycena rebaudengoi]
MEAKSKPGRYLHMFQLSAESSHYLNRTVNIALRPTAVDPAPRTSAVPPILPLRGRGRAKNALGQRILQFSRPRSSPRPSCTRRPSRSRSLRLSSHPAHHSSHPPRPLAYAYSSSDSTPSPDLAILVRGPRALLFPYPPALALARSRHSASPYALSASHDLDHRDEVDTPLMKRKLSRVKRNTTTASGRTAATSGMSSRAGGSTRSVWEREEVVLRLNAGAGVAVAVFLSQEAAVFPSLVVAAAKTAVCRSKTGVLPLTTRGGEYGGATGGSGGVGTGGEDMVQDVQAFDEVLGTTFDPSPVRSPARASIIAGAHKRRQPPLRFPLPFSAFPRAQPRVTLGFLFNFGRPATNTAPRNSRSKYKLSATDEAFPALLTQFPSTSRASRPTDF